MKENLNFSNLYKVISDNLGRQIRLKDGHNQKFTIDHSNPVVIALIFNIAKGRDAEKLKEGNPDDKKNLSSEASSFILGKRPIPPDVVRAYCDIENIENVYRYVKEEIYQQMDNTEIISNELKNIIKNSMNFPKKEMMLSEMKTDKLLADCIMVVMNQRNRVRDEKDRVHQQIRMEVNSLPDSTWRVSPSHAISIQLEGECLKYLPFNIPEGIITFHYFEEALDYIMENNLLILKVSSTNEMVRVFVMFTSYQLRKIKKEEYIDAIFFLGDYQDDFKPKASWPNYNIAKLAKNGLQQHKWVPYGYYSNNQLIGYIDFKFTVGKGVELGIELVEEDYRSQALATSLLYFVRLKHPTMYTYSGTYEENKGMRATFESAGYSIDTSVGKNGIKKDRVNLDNPQNKEQYTNSIYYIADPLLTQYK